MSAQNDFERRLSVVNGISDRRTSTAEPRPATPGPEESQARAEIAKTQLRNFNPTMVSQSVNKTALHPGGVQ